MTAELLTRDCAREAAAAKTPQVAAVTRGREANSRTGWHRRSWVQRLPLGCQQSLRRHYYGWQIRTGRFQSDEPDFRLLDRLVKPGTTVVDVGANLGTYTLRLAKLAGPCGRVFAFEPVSETFEILASNVRLARASNVVLVNAAVSRECGLVELIVPEEAGFAGHYFARTAPVSGKSERLVYRCKLDSLQIPGPVSLVKIDVEGHELQVLEGMWELISQHRPFLILEGDDPLVDELLAPAGYQWRRLTGSQNRIFGPASELGGVFPS